MHVCVRADIHTKAYRTWKKGNLRKNGYVFASDGIIEHFKTKEHTSDRYEGFGDLITMVGALNYGLRIPDQQLGSIEFSDFLWVALEKFKKLPTEEAINIWRGLTDRKKIKQQKTNTAQVALTVNQST